MTLQELNFMPYDQIKIIRGDSEYLLVYAPFKPLVLNDYINQFIPYESFVDDQPTIYHIFKMIVDNFELIFERLTEID